MSLEIRVEEIAIAALPPVEYRWDADTEILCAMIRTGGVSEGLSGSLDIEGADGAWLTLELTDGRLRSVEVAVWPEVRTVATLAVPVDRLAATIRVPARASQPGLAAVEVDTAIRAVADAAEQTIHFRIGKPRAVRVLQVARELLVEVDARDRVAGLWLLNVPPCPTTP